MKRKIYKSCLGVLFCVVLSVSGCDNNNNLYEKVLDEVEDELSEAENEIESLDDEEYLEDIESMAPTEEPTQEPVGAWKEAYKEFLLSNQSNNGQKFSLAYIDDDDIPEIVLIEGTFHAATADVYTFYNNQVCKISEYGYGEYGCFSYLERANKIYSEYSNGGYISKKYYSIVDGKENLLAEFTDDEGAVGEEMATYKFNGQIVSSYDEYVSKQKEFKTGEFTVVEYDNDCMELTADNINEQCK